MMDRFMRRFSAWFGSPAGVWQTFVITMGIVVAEHIWPHLDPNGFYLLYWLTVYSGITQNLLAYASNVSSEASIRQQNEIRAIQEEIRNMQCQITNIQSDQSQELVNHRDMIKLLIAIAKRLESGMEEIAEDVEELAEEFADESDMVADNAHRAAIKEE